MVPFFLAMSIMSNTNVWKISLHVSALEVVGKNGTVEAAIDDTVYVVGFGGDSSDQRLAYTNEWKGTDNSWESRCWS